MSVEGIQTEELEAAFVRFQSLLDRDAIDARQEHPPTTIYTPWVVVWLMIYQRMHANASLSEAVTELFRIKDQLPHNRRITEETLSTNTGSYSQARSRLDPEVAEAVSDHVFQTLMDGSPSCWEGRRVFLIDGTTTALSSVRRLRQEFPPAPNQHRASPWPILHWAVAHELSSGCAIRPKVGAKYGSEAVSEIVLAIHLLSRLPAHSLVMADSNFGVFFFHYAARTAGHDVVTRLTEARFRAWVKRATPLAPGRWELLWKPSRQDRCKHPELPADAALHVELHEVQVVTAEGTTLTLFLVTTLVDSGQKLAELYGLRFHVETDIRNVKVVLRMDELRGQSPAMLRKELALGTVAYNLVVQVRRLAAKQAGVPPRKLSFSGSWSLVKILLLQPGSWTVLDLAKNFRTVLRGCAQRKIPNRPGRRYPRQLLRQSQKYPFRPRPPD
jgi:DDE family transposase